MHPKERKSMRAPVELVEELFEASMQIDVVDAHTHIQDDVPSIGKIEDANILSGTQASFNTIPEGVFQQAKKSGVLPRRLMMDATHGLSYSWFLQIAEGGGGAADAVIRTVKEGGSDSRRQAGKMMIDALQPSRYSEYAEWLRIMFSFYVEDPEMDTLNPANYERVCDAIDSKRNDPALAQKILRDHRISGYVTSIENRGDIPFGRIPKPGEVDLSAAVHPETCNMFDAMYLIWPEGATDFGLFTGGHKYEAERYLLNLEEMLDVSIQSADDLKKGIKAFLRSILWSPTTNPESRVRYTDIFLPMDFKLNAGYDITTVNAAIRFSKEHLRQDQRTHLCAFAAEALLETLNEIGKEIKDSGSEYGSCLQIAQGVDYFMDRSREIQSFSAYRSGLPQDSYSLWLNYPHIHFEYILANESLYRDFANAAKQVSNISVGPWWHLVRKEAMARMFYEQLSFGPVNSIASGFTDARFVEMLVAKYRSVRQGLSAALAEFVSDSSSILYRKNDEAIALMKTILHDEPVKKHHLEPMFQRS